MTTFFLLRVFHFLFLCCMTFSFVICFLLSYFHLCIPFSSLFIFVDFFSQGEKGHMGANGADGQNGVMGFPGEMVC